jgi:hypothetical protein
MIDAHKAYRLGARSPIQFCARAGPISAGSWQPAIGMRFREYRPQSRIQFADQSVNNVHVNIIETKRAPEGARFGHATAEI